MPSHSVPPDPLFVCSVNACLPCALHRGPFPFSRPVSLSDLRRPSISVRVCLWCTWALLPPRRALRRAYPMSLSSLAVGKYLVTPLARITATGDYAASVSIRRGMHDRVFRFIPRFDNQGLAMQYALAQGRSMVLQNQLV